jgi:osmotically-inducible protein OsmY
MGDSNISDDNAKHNTEGSYTWAGSFPYSTKEELPGRKTDEELRSVVADKLKKMSQIDTSRVAINVVDQIVSITGSAQTYEQKRRIGEEIWKIEGVVKVLNELHVIEPSTAGPAHRD